MFTRLGNGVTYDQGSYVWFDGLTLDIGDYIKIKERKRKDGVCQLGVEKEEGTECGGWRLRLKKSAAQWKNLEQTELLRHFPASTTFSQDVI